VSLSCLEDWGEPGPRTLVYATVDVLFIFSRFLWLAILPSLFSVDLPVLSPPLCVSSDCRLLLLVEVFESCCGGALLLDVVFPYSTAQFNSVHLVTVTLCVKKAGGAGSCDFPTDAANFGQNSDSSENFHQKRFWVVKILILPLFFPKWGFSSKFCIFRRNCPTRKKFSDSSKFGGGEQLSCCLPFLLHSRCHWYRMQII